MTQQNIILAALWLSVTFFAGFMAHAYWTDFLNWLVPEDRRAATEQKERK